MPTIAERLAEFQTKRNQLAEEKSALVTKAVVDEGRTLDEHEQEKDAQLTADIESIDKTITTLKSHEAMMVTKAAPVTAVAGQGQGAVNVAGSGVISVARNLPKGTAFTRYVSALAVSKGNIMQAEVIAQRWADSTPEVGQVLKTAVAAGSTSDTTWAAPLVQYNDMTAEFIELLRPKTILGQLTSVRRVPFNIRIPRQTAGTSGTFVGEGSPTPVGKLATDNITLPWAKASTIVVITTELARLTTKVGS